MSGERPEESSLQVAESPTQIIYEQREAVLLVRSTQLHVVAGPDNGATCALTTQRVRVGTSRDNDLVLTDPGVSRHHVELQVQDLGYLLHDIGSTNGTFFRGARVRDVLLGAAAEFRVGNSVIRIERTEEQSARIAATGAFGSMIGTSSAMQKVYGVLAAVAPTDVTVLLEGETGTGKELVAQALHRESPRRDKLFGVIDCGSLPSTLIESELFGHEKGAFTGADRERIGVFERSRDGTVFLDEIGELPLPLQTRLLRVLDNRTIQRVGGNTQRRVDVRLVAATNRNLAKEVKRGTFRQDLFYRLSVVKIKLPPLRKRRDDIAQLARHFLLQAGAPDPDIVLRPELLEVLRNRRWPGNVRELRNVIERAMVMTDGPQDVENQLLEESSTKSAELSGPSTPQPVPPPPPPEPRPTEGWLARAAPIELMRQPYRTARELVMDQFETAYLGRLIEKHGANISAIARDAGVDRHMVRKLLRRRGLYE